MTKYKPQKEITKALKFKGVLAQITDSAIVHIGKFLDNLNARDIVYGVAFISATYLMYRAIKGIEITFSTFLSMLAPTMLETAQNVFKTVTNPPEMDLMKLDYSALALSFVGAYMLLKIDLGDIASTVSKLPSAVASIAMMIPK